MNKRFVDYYREAVTQKSGGGGGGSATLIEKSISANGTYNASDDNADGYSKAVVNVPNSYAAGDEGKVVSSGALVSQTSKNITQNGTANTTTNNQVVVAVPNDFLPDPTVYTKTVQEYYTRQHDYIDDAYAGKTNWSCTVLKTYGVSVGDKIIVTGDDLGNGPLHYAVWGTVTSVVSKDSTKDTVKLTVAGSTFKNTQKYTANYNLYPGETSIYDVSTINQITVQVEGGGLLLSDYLNYACDSSMSLIVSDSNVQALPMMAFCGIPNLDAVELPSCGGQIMGCFAYSAASYNVNGMTITIGNPSEFVTFEDIYSSPSVTLPCFYGCGGILALLLPDVEYVPVIDYLSANALMAALQSASGSIYVPDSLVSNFQSDSNWSMLSSYITGISGYQSY